MRRLIADEDIQLFEPRRFLLGAAIATFGYLTLFTVAG
jgi:hypothetical protein